MWKKARDLAESSAYFHDKNACFTRRHAYLFNKNRSAELCAYLSVELSTYLSVHTDMGFIVRLDNVVCNCLTHESIKFN